MFLSLQSFHRFTIDEVFQRLSADGTQASDSDGIKSSPDGRMVVFQSLAGIPPDDTNDVFDIYLRDSPAARSPACLPTGRKPARPSAPSSVPMAVS